MSQRVFRSHKQPIRKDLSWEERWKGPDKGLISCWEVGRELSQKEPELGERARNGELPVLAWKGGVLYFLSFSSGQLAKAIRRCVRRSIFAGSDQAAAMVDNSVCMMCWRKALRRSA